MQNHLNQFINALKAFLDENDLKNIDKLASRLKPYRLESRHFRTGGRMSCELTLILEDEKMARSQQLLPSPTQGNSYTSSQTISECFRLNGINPEISQFRDLGSNGLEHSPPQELRSGVNFEPLLDNTELPCTNLIDTPSIQVANDWTNPNYLCLCDADRAIVQSIEALAPTPNGEWDGPEGEVALLDNPVQPYLNVVGTPLLQIASNWTDPSCLWLGEANMNILQSRILELAPNDQGLSTSQDYSEDEIISERLLGNAVQLCAHDTADTSLTSPRNTRTIAVVNEGTESITYPPTPGSDLACEMHLRGGRKPQDLIAPEISVAPICIRADYISFIERNLPRWAQHGLWQNTSLPNPTTGGVNSEILKNVYACVCQLDLQADDNPIRQRIALILLHTVYEVAYNEWKMRPERRKEMTSIGRGGASQMIDHILERIHSGWSRFDAKVRSELRAKFHYRKRFGKRWWILSNGLGPSIVLLCSSDLSTAIRNTSVTIGALEELIHTVKICQPVAMNVLKLLDPVAESLYADNSYDKDQLQDILRNIGLLTGELQDSENNVEEEVDFFGSQ
ncbi:hypothetical protein F5884DRAFT_756307 [Xylogone sp. PMI_703]|nr:hypothetical protein F5884DRAFT_756307 [Xylogone sp. PMI_703]